METQLRALLYTHLKGRHIAFNPVEPEPFDLVDLTKDVTNATRIYHLRTECVREALEGASLIVTDSQPLADVVKGSLPKVMATALPFGHFEGHISAHEREADQPPVVGLLNHCGGVEMNNGYALALLKSLQQPLLLYGHALPGLEAEVEEDFELFVAKCDILLLPSLPSVLNSPTLPLALMAAGTAILADNAPGYYNLDAATGVQLLPHNPLAWRATLAALLNSRAKLRTMQERNRIYAQRQNRESLQRAASFIAQTASPRSAVINTDCGCAKKKGKTVSAKPNLDQSIIEKEL